MGRSVVIALLALLALSSPAAAQGPLGPPNDLLALGQGGGDTPDQTPVRKAPSPSFDAVPRAQCEAGSKPEPSVQGRGPARPAGKRGWGRSGRSRRPRGPGGRRGAGRARRPRARRPA